MDGACPLTRGPVPARPQGRPRGRYTQAARVLVLYARMESPAGGVDLEEFAAEFGIDPRTLRRDLQALRSAGAAIDSDRNSEGRWYYLTKKIPT